METRFFSMCALAVAAIAFVGCNKIEQKVETPEKAGIPFEFIASGIDTKTTNDGLHTNWKSGDQVNLFHAVAGSTTYVAETTAFAASSDGASVTFTGTLNGELTGDNYDWYAIYPYSSYITTPASTSTGYVTIGSASTGKQKQTGNSSMTHIAGSKYPVAGKALNVAKDTKPVITMSHLTTVIAVKVTNGLTSPITVSEVSFTGTEKINGTFYVDFVSDPVVYTKSDDEHTSNTATLQVASGTPIAAGANATFYLAVKPFEAPASETISISVTADNGAQVRDKELTAAANFVAGTINTLNFTYDKAASSLPEPSEVTGWYRVEKPAWLAAGDRVVIVNNGGTYAMKNLQKSNNRDGVAITVAADGLYKKITSFNDDTQVFILETGTVSGSFAFWCENGDNPSKYIYAASSTANHLKSQDSKNDNASFIATLTEGVGTLTAQGASTHKVMQFNSNLFSCYESAAYSNISVYKYYGAWTGSTTCANPTITQDGNTVTIATTTPGATIYYTTDGTDPDPSVEAQKYTHAFPITSAVTVKAIAVRSHYTDSGISSQACSPQVATPVISCSGTSFTISCATEGASIYYTTSTTDLASVVDPTSSSTAYSAAVSITQTTYVKAIAYKDGYTTSAIASATCVYSAGSPNTYSCTFTNASWETNGASDFTWTSVKNGGGFNNNGIQVTTNADYNGANANTDKTFTGVSQVIVTYNTNKSAGAGTLELKIGTNDAHEEDWAWSSGDGRTANYTCTFNVSPTESGVINLKANTTTNSIYIVGVTVKATSMSDPTP